MGVYFYASSWLLQPDCGIGDHNHQYCPSVFFWLSLQPVWLSYCSVSNAWMIRVSLRPNLLGINCTPMNQMVALHRMISPLVHQMCRISSLTCCILQQPSLMVAEQFQSSQFTSLRILCNFSHAGQIGLWPSIGIERLGLKVASGLRQYLCLLDAGV